MISFNNEKFNYNLKSTLFCILDTKQLPESLYSCIYSNKVETKVNNEVVDSKNLHNKIINIQSLINLETDLWTPKEEKEILHEDIKENLEATLNNSDLVSFNISNSVISEFIEYDFDPDITKIAQYLFNFKIKQDSLFYRLKFLIHLCNSLKSKFLIVLDNLDLILKDEEILEIINLITSFNMDCLIVTNNPKRWAISNEMYEDINYWRDGKQQEIADYGLFLENQELMLDL